MHVFLGAEHTDSYCFTTFTDTYAHIYPDSYSYLHSHFNSNGYIYPDADCYLNTYCDSNPGWCNTDTHSKTSTRSTASPNTSTTPIASINETESTLPARKC